MKKYGLHSRYYLYVQFKPGYGDSFTYHSDDSRGSKRGLENLLRRVLRRSVKGRYEYAKLVDRETRQVIGYFLANGEMYSEESWRARRQNERRRQPHLKASMAFYHRTITERQKYGLPPLLTLYAPAGNEYGRGLSCALVNLRRQVNTASQRLPYRMVYIWLHPGNKPIGQLLPDGELHITDADFYRQVLAEKLIPEAVLRMTLKTTTKTPRS